MNINKIKSGEGLIIILEGRLDTSTTPQLDEVLNAELEGISELTFDFSGLEYISSAGLRALLTAQKTMNRQGRMVVKNVSEEVNEVFEITGFSDVLTIE